LLEVEELEEAGAEVIAAIYFKGKCVLLAGFKAYGTTLKESTQIHIVEPSPKTGMV